VVEAAVAVAIVAENAVAAQAAVAASTEAVALVVETEDQNTRIPSVFDVHLK